MQYAIAIPQTYPDRVRLRRFLQRAEELPFAAAWCIEQMIGKAPVLESVTTLAYAAAVTERLRLGVAVLLIGQRNPIDLAKSLSSIEVLSNGRLIVGVGLGGSTSYYPAYGLAPEGRVARFRENLAIMKRLWTEEKVTLDGRFSHLMSIPMEPKPVQKPHPPIWFGGYAEAALRRRAVELGDGYIGASSAPMKAFLESIKQLPPDFPRQNGFIWHWVIICHACGNGSEPFTASLKWQIKWPYGDHRSGLQTRSCVSKMPAWTISC